MKKSILVCVLIVYISMLVFSKGITEESPTEIIHITAGDTNSNTFLYTNRIVDMWNKILQEKEKPIMVSSEKSAGGVSDIGLLKGNIVQFITSTDILVYEAQEGIGSFEEDAYADLRLVAGMWPVLLHIVVTSDSNIERFDDIDGRPYDIGTFGSMESFASLWILKQISHLSPGTYVDYHTDYLDAKELMINEDIIGMSVVDALPNPMITNIANGTTNIDILGFSINQFETLQKQYATIEYYTIPRGTYIDIDYDIKTVGFKTILISDAAVSDDIVYELLSSLYANKTSLQESIPLLNANDVFTHISPITMHTGALRYYKEQGIDIPDAMQSP